MLGAPLGLDLVIGEERELGVERRLVGRRPEEPGEEPRHPLAVRRERGLERLLRRVAHGAREPEPLARGREPVRLRAVHHLDAVLGAAQEEVRVGERVAVLRRDDAGEQEPLEGGQHRALAQRLPLRAAAVQELQRGDEELRLADAALAELQVVLALRARARVDARLHRLDLGEHVEVEAAPPDERLELAEELVAHGEVARAAGRAFTSAFRSQVRPNDW